MLKEPLISVIVPVYNVEEYLTRCIVSICRQTYENIQIILVDDGSTDKCGEICDGEALKDRRIEVIHQDNKGLVAARKAGLKRARGTYIGFVDGDDYISENMYKELLEGLTRSDADFIHSGFYEDYRGVNIVNEYNEGVLDISENKEAVICDNVLKTSLNSKITITPSIWSKLFKAPLIRRAYANVPDYQQFGEDVVCLCACILEADNIALTKKAYYHYVVRKNSMSHSRAKGNIVKYASLYGTLCDLFLKYGKYSLMEKDLDIYLRGFLEIYIGGVYRGQVYIGNYGFTGMRTIKGNRVVIYGAGKVGQDYYNQISKDKGCKIAAWVDQNFREYCSDYVQVLSPDVLKDIDYDVIVIAVKNKNAAEEITASLLERNIIKEKILWRKPKKRCVPINKIEPLG